MNVQLPFRVIRSTELVQIEKKWYVLVNTHEALFKVLIALLNSILV
jgi:hypothetical protein